MEKLQQRPYSGYPTVIILNLSGLVPELPSAGADLLEGGEFLCIGLS